MASKSTVKVRERTRLALGLLALAALAACGKPATPTTAETKTAAITTATTPIVHRNAAITTPTTAVKPPTATTTSQRQEPITFTIEAITTTPKAIEPPITIPTKLRHRNQDAYNQITVTPANEHECTFVVFGESRGDAKILAQALEQASREKGALFAVHVGNMVSSATEAQYAEFLKLVDEHLKIPLLAVPGPGDLSGGGDSSLYRQIFGWPPYYQFQIGHTCFVMIDDSRPEALDAAQLARLEKGLSRSMSEVNQFIFMNKPLLDPRVGGKAGLGQAESEKLMKLFAIYEIDRIFSGNISGLYSGTWKGARYYITGGAGVALTGRDPNHDFHNYLVVKVSSSDVTITARRITPAGTEPAKNADGEVLGDLKIP